jgi:Zn finger protein HypA/HybF involved in hydrogenase expression
MNETLDLPISDASANPSSESQHEQSSRQGSKPQNLTKVDRLNVRSEGTVGVPNIGNSCYLGVLVSMLRGLKYQFTVANPLQAAVNLPAKPSIARLQQSLGLPKNEMDDPVEAWQRIMNHHFVKVKEFEVSVEVKTTCTLCKTEAKQSKTRSYFTANHCSLIAAQEQTIFDCPTCGGGTPGVSNTTIATAGSFLLVRTNGLSQGNTEVP